MPESAFVVDMRTENRSVASVHLELKATDEKHFIWGYPVAYFSAAQQDEAIEYASWLAALHGANRSTPTRWKPALWPSECYQNP